MVAYRSKLQEVQTMKRLVLGSLSIFLLSTVISPAVRAEVNSSSTKNYDELRQNLIAQKQDAKELVAIADDGTPENLATEEWLTATGEIFISEVNSDGYTVTVKANNLVPNGLYTLWWVNKQIISMDMGPVGGLPDNEFRADSEGNATTTISVPANNDYQMLVAAYHADDRTHAW